MAWHSDPALVSALSRRTEVPVVELKRPSPTDGTSDPATWGIGVDRAPSVVMIRETEDGIDVSIDWFSLSAKAIGTLEDDPAAYVAGTIGLGMTVGAMLGRTGKAAAAGAVVGGLLGLWSQVNKGR